MLKTEFIKLYEALGQLNEAEDPYLRAAMQMYQTAEDAEGIVVSCTPKGKAPVKICKLYYTDAELQKIIKEIHDKYGDVEYINAYHNRSAIAYYNNEWQKADAATQEKAQDSINELFSEKLEAALKTANISLRHFSRDTISELYDEYLPKNIPADTDEQDRLIKLFIKGVQAKSKEKDSTTISDVKPEPDTQPAEPKNAKLTKAKQNNNKIVKAFKEVGLPTDELITTATNKNGKEYKKASTTLNKLRKTLFGEALAEETNFDQNITFLDTYEELDTLNEGVLTEGRYDDFSKIPVEDLLTKCIIDGDPWPHNPDYPEKSGIVPFYTALNEIINIVKKMNDERKAEFTLDWIAIGSIKDLIGTTTTVANKPRPRSNSLMRDTNYSIAVETAEMELDRVIQQVGSDETELSSLQKLPILLKSNIIMCCRPSTALEEANNKDNEMANIAVYLGGVGKLAPYYSEIQQAFKQIKKAYEGSFLSKVAAKLFKREELEAEELNTLNEAVSPEVQSFYNSLKLTNKDPVDTESFIKAFKKDIPDNIWDQLFTVDMRLKNRGTYGIIKNGNLPEDVTAALKKYWAFQFASSVTWFETTTMIAKKKEAKRKEEEEKKAQEEKLVSEAKEYIDRANHVLTLVDKTAMQKLLQLSKELEPEVANKMSETPKVKANHYTSQKNRSGKPYSTISIHFYDFWVTVYDGYYGDNPSIPTEQELVDKFNGAVLRAIERLEKIKAEKLAKQNRQEKYKNAKWYSKEFEEWASANKRGVFLFQLSDDEGIQRLTKLSWDVIERCHFTDEVELIAVITDYDPPMNNPYSATESSYYYRYYSVNSKANPADLEEEGILLDPSKFVDDSSWGEKHYREVPRQKVENDDDYFKTGMDKWFYYSSESYGTD